MTTKLLPGDINDAVFLAKQEVAGTHLLTFGQYRKVARALVDVHLELEQLKHRFCPERSQGHVRPGHDVQCSLCHMYLGKHIDELIANSSIGAGLRDIQERGLDAHLKDLEKELDRKRGTRVGADTRNARKPRAPRR